MKNFGILCIALIAAILLLGCTIQNAPPIVYSYNNIIMASEISEVLFNELKKNQKIDYIESVPLKRYGEIDYLLIDQVGSSGITRDISGNSDTSTNTISAIIINDNFDLSALTYDAFSYTILSNGTTPITYSFIKPDNYKGELSISSNKLIGKSYSEGIYDITLNTLNNYGSDSKILTLTTIEYVKILNTNLSVYTKIGSQFSYSIESSGSLPKTYAAIGLPSGLTLDSNGFINGSISIELKYYVTISVTGTTGSDSKQLEISSGNAPVITSSSEIINEQYSNFEYYITSDPTSSVTYNISGTLPTGLIFKINRIYGVPSDIGIFNIKLKVSSSYGESTKDLKITIYAMGT